MNADVFVQKYAKVFNSGDVKALGALYASGAVLSHPMMGRLESRAAIEAAEGPMFSAFSAVEWKPKRVVAQGDVVAIQFTVGATNTGPLQTPAGPLPATNKTVNLEGAAFYKLDSDGLIAEEQRYLDTAQFFAQLGLAK